MNPIRFIDPLGLAQICTRPLKGSRGFRTNGKTGFDLGIFHAHIFFDDGTNIGYGGDSGLFSEPKTNDYTCNKEKYNDEIMKKAVEIVKNEPDNLLLPKGSKQYGSDNYGFIVNNCQDFVSDVLDEYKKNRRRETMNGFLVRIFIADISILSIQAALLLYHPFSSQKNDVISDFIIRLTFTIKNDTILFINPPLLVFIYYALFFFNK